MGTVAVAVAVLVARAAVARGGGEVPSRHSPRT